MRKSVVSCSGGLVFSACSGAFKRFRKENYSDISKACYLRCLRTVDRLTHGEDWPFAKKATGLGRDSPPWPAQLDISDQTIGVVTPGHWVCQGCHVNPPEQVTEVFLFTEILSSLWSCYLKINKNMPLIWLVKAGTVQIEKTINGKLWVHLHLKGLVLSAEMRPSLYDATYNAKNFWLCTCSKSISDSLSGKSVEQYPLCIIKRIWSELNEIIYNVCKYP